MAENIGATSGSNASIIPVFKGDGYEHWSLRMKTILRSKDLWDVVFLGVTAAGDGGDQNNRELRKRDAQAMTIIQQGVHDTLFSRIAGADTAKETWEILQVEFQGDSQVQSVKLQGLRRAFENLSMKEDEIVGDYFSRVMNNVGQQRSYGEDVADQKVVEKILRSLSPKFDYVIPSIEVTFDLAEVTPVKLMGLLQSQEERINSRLSNDKGNKVVERSDEQALPVVQEANRNSNYRDANWRGRGRGASRGRGFGRGRGNLDRSKVPQCYVCKKFGHLKKDCWYNNDEPRANVAENEQREEPAETEEQHVFMISTGSSVNKVQTWFMDSGASNHMTGKLLIQAPVATNNMFVVDPGCLLMAQESASSRPYDTETLKWHNRLGHLHFAGLKQLHDRGMVQGLPNINQHATCESCITCKQARLPFKGTLTRAKARLELVHTDLCGPMQVPSLGNSFYYLLFIDDLTRMCWVYFVTHKSEVFTKFRLFKAMVERECERSIKVLRSDRGGEFCSVEFNRFCEQAGIKRELTVAYTPQHNGVVERKNRTVMNLARSMLHERHLPNFLWAEAVSTAVYVLNRSPTKALVNQTPLEAWSGKKPSVSHMKTFGCVAYGLVPAQLRRKLENKSEKCIFLGYSDQTRGYRLFNPNTKAFSVKRDVTFLEDTRWDWSCKSAVEKNKMALDPFPLESSQQKPASLTTSTANEESMSPLIQPTTPNFNPSTSSTSSRTHTSPSHESELPIVSTEQNPNSSNQNPNPSKRQTKTPAWLADYVSGEGMSEEDDDFHACQFALNTLEPISFKEAAESCEWQKAMQSELQAIAKNKTWELVSLPPGKNVVGVKWVFKVKQGEDAKGIKYKARLVAKGYSQQPGIDFQETFAPVARFETVRVILSVAANMGWLVHQMDVKSAFLNGDLNEEIYLEQPEGFVIPGKEKMVYKLHKALYGLKQAPRAWYAKIDGFFVKNGFERSNNEPTLYTRKDESVDIEPPSKIHLGAARRILKYVASTADYGIWYKKTQECKLVGFSDSDWAGCPDDRKSISAYIYVLGGSVVAWSSKKQATVALSSTEAEYIAASSATCEAIWLRRLLEDLGFKQKEATVIFCDNKSAINLSKNPVLHNRSKHIELRYHYIREMVLKEEVSLEYCNTNVQLADVLTKSLSREKFVFYREAMGVVNFGSRKGED
ncbi:putative RNA-directed DNA polymerase [Helianthus annuus]|nr:putative RNA-directed DNA polymerase [Helianthus annuus]